MSTKTDKVEFEKRLMNIQGWIIDGVPTTLIIQQIMLKGWSQSERHAYRMLKKATQRWVQYEDDNRDNKRKLKVQELKNRIRGMSNQFKSTPGGMRAILAYEKEIIKLEGLYYVHPTKHGFNHPGSFEDAEVIPPTIAQIEAPSEIDYTKLSDDVLQAIVKARIIND